MVVEEYAWLGTIDDALQRTEHDTLFIAERGSRHVQRTYCICRWEEERQQTVFGPAEFIGVAEAVAGTVEVVLRIGERDLFHFAYFGALDGSVVELSYHRGGLLSH